MITTVVFLFLVSLGSLLSVFGLLAGTAAAVGTGDIAFFLGFGPHLVAALVVAVA